MYTYPPQRDRKKAHKHFFRLLSPYGGRYLFLCEDCSTKINPSKSDLWGE